MHMPSCIQIIELLWNLLELAPGAAQQAMSAAAAEAKGSAPRTQQQIQQIEQQHQVQGSSSEPPWQLAATAAAPADIWVRQSCSPSCVNSRPTTSMPSAVLQQSGSAAAAGGSRPDSTHTAGSDSAAAAPSCSSAAAQLVEVLGCMFKQQLQLTSSRQVRLIELVLCTQ
jgi:hypothetical protein